MLLFFFGGGVCILKPFGVGWKEGVGALYSTQESQPSSTRERAPLTDLANDTALERGQLVVFHVAPHQHHQVAPVVDQQLQQRSQAAPR